MSIQHSAKTTNGEPWDEQETQLLRLHMDAGHMDKTRKLQALEEINKYRKTRQDDLPERNLKSLGCKVFRMLQQSEQGLSVLPGPDTEKAISDLLSSSQKVIAELERQNTLQRTREQIRAMEVTYYQTQSSPRTKSERGCKAGKDFTGEGDVL
jgi:hypothetical protein